MGVNQSTVVLERRQFLGTATAAGVSGILLLWRPRAARSQSDSHEALRIGLVADVHKDVMHDSDARLSVFVQRMQREKPDFVMQMGDFCIPIPENKSFMDVWKRLEMPRYHVLGNHDMDGDGRNRPDEAYAFTREETMAYWGMEKRYFSFDVKGVHFVVLDGNDEGGAKPGYRRYVAADQAEWLDNDLAATRLPTIAMIHQSLEREDGGVENQEQIRAILDQANRGAGFQKVVACFSGHHHRDYVRTINGIFYPQINSMSYHWLGGDHLHVRYSKEIDEKYPYIKYTAPYKDPLYALVTIEVDKGQITIEGVESEFVGPSPWEMGADRAVLDADSLLPSISNRKLRV